MERVTIMKNNLLRKKKERPMLSYCFASLFLSMYNNALKREKNLMKSMYDEVDITEGEKVVLCVPKSEKDDYSWRVVPEDNTLESQIVDNKCIITGLRKTNSLVVCECKNQAYKFFINCYS